jgi:hypothetical protein
MLLLVPFALAHDPWGTPKYYCESPAEWNVHEYGAPATGRLLQGFEDGNLDNCNRTIALGTPCVGVDPNDPINSFFVDLCGFDSPALEYDGHAEYARGGAWLLVDSGDGSSGGTLLCYGEAGHHPAHPLVQVADLAWPSNVHFTVAVDLLAFGFDPCGDFETDWSKHCIDACAVESPPGLDGAYQVFVGHTEVSPPGVEVNLPTQGHVITS